MNNTRNKLPADNGGRPAKRRQSDGPGKEKRFGRPDANRQADRKPQTGRFQNRIHARQPVSGDRKPAGMEGMASRRAALQVLREVTEQGRWASLSLNAVLTKSGLSMQERRFATRLAYDTIDNMIRLDWVLNQLIAKPDTDIRLRNILRLGAAQLLLEDAIPESAACNTSVQLCREIGLEGLSGVCNGILRNLVRKKDELTWPDPEREPLKWRSIRYSVPEWLVEKLDADWGTETADALMSGRFQESVCIRPNLLCLNDAEFEALLGRKVWRWEKGTLPHAYHISGMADLGSDADFLRGLFSIQSEGSMLACYAMDVKPGMQVLDLCAAPGGKSCFLSELMQDTGRVQAWDLHPHRRELIEAQVQRLHLDNIRPIVRDAAEFREDCVLSRDAVLLDAPCSGLGNLGDKPDMKLRLKQEDVQRLVQTQEKLLDTCASYVKVGGTLVYSTCSVLKEENETQIRRFLERHPEYACLAMPETVPAILREKQTLGLQLMPGTEGFSGFYVARLRRIRK